ncbi:MAG: MaoC family dehydratase N-terminal domain-containing protein [Roseiflexaceae bacterium]|nr:MaoC family dehydratase N-terminal domain-containing protein [Roseiflexaceae bacterium]
MKRIYYEDYAIGDSFTTPGRTITEADVVLFAGLSGDYNRLHTDAEYMRSSPFGERIAHGLLGLAVVNGLKYRTDIDSDGIIAFLGLNWSFTAPIRFGDTIHAVLQVASLRETSTPDRGIIVKSVQAFNQRGELVQQGEFTMLVKRREGATADDKMTR